MSVSKDNTHKEARAHGKCMLSRRQLLVYGSTAAVAASTISVSLFPGTAEAKSVPARVTGYPRKLVARLSELKDNQPVDFNYPDDGRNTQSMLVKTGVQCGGGIGSERDVVGFSYMCTHQGGATQRHLQSNGPSSPYLGPMPIPSVAFRCSSARHYCVWSGLRESSSGPARAGWR